LSLFVLHEHLKLRTKVREIPHEPAFIVIVVGPDSRGEVLEDADKALIRGMLGVYGPLLLLKSL
jgi:hypothetical protein